MAKAMENPVSKHIFLSGLQTAVMTGPLDEAEVVALVRTELLGKVVQRRPHAADHAIQVRGVPRVMEDLDRDIVPPCFMHRVVGGEEGYPMAGNQS